MGDRKLVNPIPKKEWELLQPMDYKTMYELGNKKNAKGVYKTYFESLGINHISIDLNGQNGALPLDLGAPIDLPSRDIVTNIGTIEHVYNQKEAFKNIHNLSHYKVLHIMPLAQKGNFKYHGLYHYKEDFYKSLAQLNNYDILKIGTYGINNRLNMFCIYDVRNKKQFKWKDTLPIKQNNTGQGGIKRVYFNYD